MESSSTCSYQEQEQEIPKMPLFEKPLTQSDVGNLNRLVIPKQHAENHFPYLRNDADDQKSSLLSFEDEEDDGCRIEKAWEFRYSYWNSSQSYVLTRGWSRFVKEKRLHAGDIVVFSRHPSDSRRLFIGWRRRRSGNKTTTTTAASSDRAHNIHRGSCFSLTNIKPSGNSKKLRLFGVNLECPLASDESEPSMSGGSPISSQGRAHHSHPYHQYYDFS